MTPSREELVISMQHDCERDRDNCDELHPNAEKCVIASGGLYRYQDTKPQSWRNWLLTPKVALLYMNQHTLKMESFNLTEAFGQMSTNAKLNVLHKVIRYLLDEDERSLFFADLQEMASN